MNDERTPSPLFTAITLDKRIVQSILENAAYFPGWSLQGFGMLRLYLTKEVRLHVWDDSFAVPNVSLIHDHPWDFESYIVAGEMTNTRFILDEQVAFTATGVYHNGPVLIGSDPYKMALIKCGPGGGMDEDAKPQSVGLIKCCPELYEEGDIYKQDAREIHKSVPKPGTVTVVDRVFRSDTEHARVFWEAGGSWVSAEPRPATPREIKRITQRALSTYF